MDSVAVIVPTMTGNTTPSGVLTSLNIYSLHKNYFYKVGEYWPILLVILGFYIIIKRKKDND